MSDRVLVIDPARDLLARRDVHDQDRDEQRDQRGEDSLHPTSSPCVALGSRSVRRE
jgi:hypothetical protein